MTGRPAACPWPRCRGVHRHPGSHGERHGFIEQVDGTTVHRMALRLPWELPVNPLAPPEVRRRLAAGGFDVAHVHMGVVSPFATDMADVALGLGLPTAITWHCLIERSRPFFRLTGHARRWAARGPRSAPSPGSRQSPSGASSVLAPRWRSSPTASTSDSGRPLPRASGLTKGRCVVAAMRLAARKRPRAVLEVAAAARAQLPPGPASPSSSSARGRSAGGSSTSPRHTTWRSGPGLPRQQGRAARAVLERRPLPDPRAAGGLRHRCPRGPHGRAAGPRALRNGRRGLRAARRRRPPRSRRRRTRQRARSAGQ